MNNMDEALIRKADEMCLKLSIEHINRGNYDPINGDWKTFSWGYDKGVIIYAIDHIREDFLPTVINYMSIQYERDYLISNKGDSPEEFNKFLEQAYANYKKKCAAVKNLVESNEKKEIQRHKELHMKEKRKRPIFRSEFDIIDYLTLVEDLIETGNSLFSSEVAFDLFSKAVEREVYYAEESVEIAVKACHENECGIDICIDKKIDWLGWSKKMKQYANMIYSGFGGFKTDSLWSKRYLIADEKHTFETSSNGIFGRKIEEPYQKYKIRETLLNISNILKEIYSLTELPSKDGAIRYFNFKYDEYKCFHFKEIETEYKRIFALIPEAQFQPNLREQEEKAYKAVENSNFYYDRKDDYTVKRYFYPNGTLDKETAGKYLIKYKDQIKDEQKNAFFRYIIVKELIDEELKKRNIIDVTLDSNKSLANLQSSNEIKGTVIVVDDHFEKDSVTLQSGSTLNGGKYKEMNSRHGGNTKKPLFTDNEKQSADKILKNQSTYVVNLFKTRKIDVVNISTKAGMAMNLLTAVYQKWSVDELVENYKNYVNIKAYYRFLVNDCKFTFEKKQSNVEKQLKKSIQGFNQTSLLSQN